MPAQVDDYSDDDETGGDQLSAGGGGGAGSSAGGTIGPQQASYSKQQQDAYVPWSSFVNANQDVSDREAAKLQNQAQGDVSGTQSQLGQIAGDNSSRDASNYEGWKSNTDAQGRVTGGSNDNIGPDGKPKGPSGAASSSDDTSNPAKGPDTSGAPLGPKGAPKGAAPQPVGATATSNPWASLATPLASTAPVQATATPLAQTAAPLTTSSSPGPAHHPAPPQQQNSTQASAQPLPQSYAAPAQAQGATPLAANAATAQPIIAKLAAPQNGLPNGPNTLMSDVVNGRGAVRGAPDLETAAGADTWASLLGNATKAEGEANALGSETGVQALLQQQQAGPENSAFDAALINGSGGPGFQKLAQQYGGQQLEQQIAGANQNAQNQWASLQGDLAARHASDAAEQAAGPAASGDLGATASPLDSTAPVVQTEPGRLDTTQGPVGGVTFSATSGANGQFDASQVPPGFDPSTDPRYQQALAALQQDVPIPADSATPQDFLKNHMQNGGIGQSWMEQLGMTAPGFIQLLQNMPAWEWQLFARGMIPSDLQRNVSGNGGHTAGGYFEGYSPTETVGFSAGTDPSKKTGMDIFTGVLNAILGAVGGGFVPAVAGAASSGITDSNKHDPTLDPVGNDPRIRRTKLPKP